MLLTRMSALLGRDFLFVHWCILSANNGACFRVCLLNERTNEWMKIHMTPKSKRYHLLSTYFVPIFFSIISSNSLKIPATYIAQSSFYGLRTWLREVRQCAKSYPARRGWSLVSLWQSLCSFPDTRQPFPKALHLCPPKAAAAPQQEVT